MTMLLMGAGVQTVTAVELELPQVASATLLLDLRASQIVGLGDGDPVSTWADASGNGHDFTQTGSARPTYQISGGVPYVNFDPANSQWLEGGNNYADNLPSFTIFARIYSYTFAGGENIIIKETDAATEGWEINSGQIIIYNGSSFCTLSDNSGLPNNQFFILTQQVNSVKPFVADMFFNGVSVDPQIGHDDPIDNYSTTGTVKIGRYHDVRLSLAALLIYAPAPNATDRAAIETWLATNP